MLKPFLNLTLISPQQYSLTILSPPHNLQTVIIPFSMFTDRQSDSRIIILEGMHSRIGPPSATN